MAQPPQAPTPNTRDSSSAGFTLIEMLVVLAILAALSIAFVYSIGSKSPRAVKTALLETKSAMQEARQAAIAGGRQVNLVITDTGEQRQFQAYFTQDDGTIITDTGNAAYIPPVVERTFEKSWRRYADITTDPAPVPDEAVPMKDLPSLATFGFTGWAKPLLAGNSTFGFSNAGFPQALTNGGKDRVVMTGGTWVGIAGKYANQQGRPYGGVFITERGAIMAFYKPDAKLDTQEFKWQRME